VKKTRQYAAIAIVVVLVLVVVAVYGQSLMSRGNSTASGAPHITLTAIDAQWNGQTYALVSESFDNTLFGVSQGNSPGADVGFGFVNNGAGFSPTNTFSITPLTPGFEVLWVVFCHPSNGCSGGGTSYSQFSTLPDEPLNSTPQSWSEDVGSVDMTSVASGSTTYVEIGIQFPSSQYDGPLMLLVS
jgi:hypothetical protein